MRPAFLLLSFAFSFTGCLSLSPAIVPGPVVPPSLFPITEFEDRPAVDPGQPAGDALATQPNGAGRSTKPAFILTSETCVPCVAWKRAVKLAPQAQTVEKRFIDVPFNGNPTRPDDVDAGEWASAITHWESKGRLVPFVWWKDKAGTVQALIGRYSDWQLEWSMRAADEQVAIPQQSQQQQQNQNHKHRPQRIHSSPIAQLSCK